MSLRLPPERPLPDADAVLRRVLDEVTTPGRRFAVSRRVLPLVAAVVVAIVALGAVGLLGGRRPAIAPAGPATAVPSTSTSNWTTTAPGPSAGVVRSSDGTLTWTWADVTLEPPGDRRPALSASAVVAAFCAKGACVSRGEPQVTLGLATTHGSGTARADGSIAPLADRALVYALQWQTTCELLGPGPRSTSRPSTACTDVSLIDADTGVELFGFSGG